MTTDSETTEQCLNFVQTRFLISVLVFVSRDYKLGTKISCDNLDFGGVDHQSRTWLIFYRLYVYLHSFTLFILRQLISLFSLLVPSSLQ